MPKSGRTKNESMLCILVASEKESILADLKSKRLLRAKLPHSVISAAGLFEIIFCNYRYREIPVNPAKPEAITIVGPIEVTGSKLRRYKARRILKLFLASPKAPLLDIPAPATNFWSLNGTSPSVCVVKPDRGPMAIIRKDLTVWVRFGHGSYVEELYLADKGLASMLAAKGPRIVDSKRLGSELGFDAQFLVVALSEPENGYCYKEVVGILP